MLAAPASADTTPSPPFIDHTEWQHWGDLVSLRVYPAAAGREAAGQLVKPPWEADEAWGEVLAMAPDADTPGMRAQFVCHFRFAEVAAAGQDQLEPRALAAGGRRQRDDGRGLQSRRLGRAVLMTHTRGEVAALVDHTLLKPEATDADVAALVAEAVELGVLAVCVSPSMVSAAHKAAGRIPKAS